MCFAGVEQNVSSIFYGTETWDLCFEGVRQVVVCWDYKSAQFATFSSSKASFEFLFWWITFSLLKLLKYCSFPSTWELKEVTKLGGESISSQSFIPSFWPSFMFLWSWNNHVLKDCIWSTFSSLDFNIQFNMYFCLKVLECLLAGAERVDGVGVDYFFWGGDAMLKLFSFVDCLLCL